MTRRNLELVLLCVAAPLVVLMFAMIALNDSQPLNLTTLGVPLGIFVSFIIAHLAVRRFAPGADPAILPIVFALAGIGIAFITSLEAFKPDLEGVAMRQVMWLFFGVGCMIAVLAFIRNIDKLANYKYTLMIIGFALLLSPLLPFVGTEIYGSRIWLSIAGFSFQPGELAKIAIVLFLAAYLAQNREMLSVFTWQVGPFKLPDIRTLLPLLVMWAIAMVIVVFEKDLGSALVFFAVFLVMIYVATGKKFYVIVGLGLATIGALAAWAVLSHVQVRVDTWLNPFADYQNTGYQLSQAIFSMADGDLFGVGIGRGFAYQIPVVESDFIFAAIAEEAGLLGAAGLLLLYLCLAIRGLVTAARAKSDMSAFVAVGLTATLILQAFIIVGGVTRLIPLTGITLPFVSQGGSSLLAGFIMVGFLLRCGDEATGVGKEMKSSTTTINLNGVLGRVSLGKRITNIMIVFSLLFALLVANLTIIMVVQADEYQNMNENTHTLLREERNERGTISTYDGVALAQSVKQEDGTYIRTYPAGDLATHIVGYYSTRYGTSGIEASYNNTLKGQENYANWTDVLNVASGAGSAGNDVTLTVNSKIQRAAQDALSGYSGACVVIDPKTGAVLGMASTPTYNASDIESLLSSSSEGSALLNRATQSLYSPGSTYKIVSLSTALENNTAKEDTVYSSPGTMDIGGAAVSNYGKYDYGDITLQHAMEVSSNTVFGQLGTQIGARALVDASERFGFNRPLQLDVPTATSVMPDPDEMTEWELAWAAAGEPVLSGARKRTSEAGPQVTALQMAMVGSAIANDGTIQTPYFVDSIRNSNGEKSFTATPENYARPISANTANRVKKVMEGVVNNGTGVAAAVPGVQVAGKTGTAQTGKAEDDSWFVGLAPSDKPTVVIAIVLEEAADGTATARAQNVLKTVLTIQGVL